jgi:hypothetical protein
MARFFAAALSISAKIGCAWEGLMFRLSMACLAVVFLASCGPKAADVARTRQEQQRQLSEVELSNCARSIQTPARLAARDTLVHFADCVVRAENMNNRPDPLNLQYAEDTREVGILWRDGTINWETARLRMRLITAEHELARERRENERRIVAAQQAQARAANCANVRYRNRTSSNRAIDSTIPAVAILGLFAEIGAMSEEAQACD